MKMRKFRLQIIIAVILALALVFSLGGVVAAANDRVVPKGKLQTVILVHYEKPPDTPGKGPPDKGNGDDGDKDIYHYELLGPKWSSTVSYTIDTSFSPVDPTAGANEIIAAFEAWDAATSMDLFAEPAVTEGVTVDFYDEDSTVSWRILSGYPKAIAVTALRYDDIDGNGMMSSGDVFAAFDVVLNLMQKWAIDPDGDGPEKPDAKGKWFDVRNIATHEAGHVVGLDDLYDNAYSELTMYGYASPKETKKIYLEEGDILGTQKLYGS